MKNTIALLLSFLFILACAVLAVSAKSVETNEIKSLLVVQGESNSDKFDDRLMTDEGDFVKNNIDDVGEKEFLYRYKLDEYLRSIGFLNTGRSIVAYDEPYCHKDKSGVNDWALVYASSGQRGMEIGAYKVGNRVIRTNTAFKIPFCLDLAVYDVEKETFIDLAHTGLMSEPYDGLGRYVDENCKGLGILLGDIDRDDELTILDCTLLQRCDIKAIDWPEKDQIDVKPAVVGFPDLRYYSDFDCDGERDVVDATKLQRYVTRID